MPRPGALRALPPEGERGLTTFAGHNDFATVPDVAGFVAERNRNILLFVQIETRAGLENGEATSCRYLASTAASSERAICRSASACPGR